MIHNDHLATPQKLTDSTGTVVWAADYKPFGEATITTSTITNNLRFPGQYYDAETGLYYNYFRDYDPTMGRYIEADPIGISFGENHIYHYALNNALLYFDDEGASPKKRYEKPQNPNKRKGADARKPSGERERNIGHPDAEEHSRKPKGNRPIRFIAFCEERPKTCAAGAAAGVAIMCLTPWPDELLFGPALLSAF